MGRFPQFYTLGEPVTVPAFGGSVYVRIGENARKAVVFFGVPGAGAQGENIEYGGTGFLVSFSEGNANFTHLVTCRHVAVALKEHEGTGFFVRINTQDGKSVPVPLGKVEWQFPEDATIDLAFCWFSIDGGGDHVYIPLVELSADRDNSTQVGIGDDLSIVGLFRPHAGSNRNLPIVHTGNIALLANSTELVPVIDRQTKMPVLTECYLIEAQTLDGCSGAPVFVHQTVVLGLFKPDEFGNPTAAYRGVRLLGVYSGSWDGEPSDLLAKDRRLGKNRKVPVGMGTVVPIDQLVAAIRENPTMRKGRKEYIDKLAAERAATQDSSFQSPPRSTDENPTHREDFMSLANAAARKQKLDE